MKSLYSRWITAWEEKLCFRATDRVVRPFEWGLEWSKGWPAANEYPLNGDDPESYLLLMNQRALSASEEFFGYDVPRDFNLYGDLLQFTSPVVTPFADNNTVYARWFPAKDKRKAVVLLPHWNAQTHQHVTLCRGLQKLGISCLRLSLPYHDQRMPVELRRADYAVSSNVGRTIDAGRQAVIDARCSFDWLEQHGYESLGIIGTSLGSCYACLASAHDERIRVNVFNHCSTYFADVVWTGLSTRHIRESMEGSITLERLRETWRGISPFDYLPKLARKPKKSLFVYARYDTTFLPSLSRDIVREVGRLGIDHRVIEMPCGHYTLGETPFKFIVGYHICAFLKRNM